MAKGGYVYIMSNKTRTTVYTGVTSNLSARVNQHQFDSDSVFVKRYRCFHLVYYEFHETITGAIEREKQIKKWKRAWKDELIRSINPEIEDLSDDVKDLI